MKKNNKNEDRNVIYVPNKQINNQNPWLNLKEQTMFFNITKINYWGILIFLPSLILNSQAM